MGRNQSLSERNCQVGDLLLDWTMLALYWNCWVVRLSRRRFGALLLHGSVTKCLAWSIQVSTVPGIISLLPSSPFPFPFLMSHFLMSNVRQSVMSRLSKKSRMKQQAGYSIRPSTQLKVATVQSPATNKFPSTQ